MALGGDRRDRAARGRSDDRQHRPEQPWIDAEVITEQHDHTRECHDRPADRPHRDALRGHVEIRHADRENRQRRKEDGRQAAVEILLGPVDQPVVAGEERQPDDRDQAPLPAAPGPRGAEQWYQDGEDGCGEQETERGDVEGTQASVAHLDHEPARWNPR